MRARLTALALAATLAALMVAGLAVTGAADDPAGGTPSRSDPATQRQRSLAEAARQHLGPGTLGVKPARDVKPRRLRRLPSDVLPDPKSTGRLSSGCVLGYGVPGDQCLPARALGGKPITCAYAVELFPDGVRVTGRDILNLDSDKDGRACGPGDRGVP
jgi:hypothetical protein